MITPNLTPHADVYILYTPAPSFPNPADLVLLSEAKNVVVVGDLPSAEHAVRRIAAAAHRLRTLEIGAFGSEGVPSGALVRLRACFDPERFRGLVVICSGDPVPNRPATFRKTHAAFEIE